MATTVFYANQSATYVQSSDTTYLTARSGGTMATGATLPQIGQRNDAPWLFWECFVGFDTSSLPDTDTVSAAILDLYGHSTSGFNASDIIRARLRDFGATTETADFVAGASLGGIGTLLATWTPGTWSTTAYNTFVNVAMPANVNKTGSTRMIVVTKLQEDGTANDSQVRFFGDDEAGTTKDPKLTVTHSAPAAAGRSFGVIVG